MKNSKWLYLYTKTNNDWWIFFERWKYRVHLVWIEDVANDLDKILFSIAKYLWFNDFKEQFNQIIKQASLLEKPLFTLYVKDEYKNIAKKDNI